VITATTMTIANISGALMTISPRWARVEAHRGALLQAMFRVLNGQKRPDLADRSPNSSAV
jgi:hypothetical protein